MSKIALTPNATGTGTFTISSPATNTNRTLTLPDEAGTVLVNGTTSNVGIGTSSPTANRKLDAVMSDNASAGIRVTNSNGGIYASSNTSYSNGTTNHEFGILGTAYATYGVLEASEAYVYGSSRNISFAADGASSIKFGTGAGVPERMRIDSSGRLLIGTTVALGQGGLTFTPSATGVACVWDRVATAANTVAASYRNGGTQVGYIQYSNTATTYSTSSDYRLKTDAQPMTGASARVQALNPVNFAWIVDGSRVDGFLAHEAQ